MNNTPEAPIAKKIPHELITHGHKRIDNYYWLREKENPEVLTHLKAERAYCDAMLKHTEPLQKELFEEIKSRIKENDQSVPYRLDDYFYYSRFEQGLEYPLYCRKFQRLEAKEEIMLNVNELAEGFSFFTIGDMSISRNQQILAFSEDNAGNRIYTLKFKDLSTNTYLADSITAFAGSFVWASDNKTIFYVRHDEQTLRSHQIWKHILGTPSDKDILVYQEDDELFDVGLYKTKSKKYIFIASNSKTSTEMRFIESEKPESEFKLFAPKTKDLEYSVEHYEDKFFILTNWNAKNFRLMSTSLDKTDREKDWKEEIAHRPDVFLEGLEIFKDYFVLSERKNGLINLRVINWKDKNEHYIDFGEAAYTAYISQNPDFNTETLRYGYTSLTTPSSVFDYDMRNKTKILLKQQEVLGGYQPENYQAERIYATAKDGTKVPISLVYKKGLQKNGENPLYLTGYGSYGISYDVGFSYSRISLLDRGFVFAIAHIRGGQELGREWYENGKFLHKKNTFTDFIACTEHLIAEKFSNSNKIVANGGSAGGLLMGAVMNLRPDLYKAIIADVPFVDVVTTMLDESLPLTTGEYEEWGNPNDKKYYDYMLSYSPYDNVEAKNYPHLLVTTGFNDSQVQYFEPAKWVCKLREMKTDKNLLLFHITMDVGHQGTSGRFESLKEIALEYAFVLDILKK